MIISSFFDMLIGAILAGGKGSRMKSVTDELRLPKHLLPLGNGQNPTSRLGNQLLEFCERVVCVVDQGQQEIFSQNVPGDIELIEKSGEIPFVACFEALCQKIQGDVQLLVTTGDIVFDSQEVSRVGQEVVNLGEKTKVYMEGDAIRFFTTQKRKLEQLTQRGINPESILSAVGVGLSVYGLDVLRGRFRFGQAKALVNINTPADYEQAKSLFQ